MWIQEVAAIVILQSHVRGCCLEHRFLHCIQRWGHCKSMSYLSYLSGDHQFYYLPFIGCSHTPNFEVFVYPLFPVSFHLRGAIYYSLGSLEELALSKCQP